MHPPPHSDPFRLQHAADGPRGVWVSMGWSLRAAHCKSFHVLECAIRDEASEARKTTPVPTSAAQDGVKTSHHGMPASGSAVKVVMLANGIGCPSLASSRDSHLSRSRKQKPMCPRPQHDVCDVCASSYTETDTLPYVFSVGTQA